MADHPGWAFVHNMLAHPLLALTGSAAWAVRFHDYTAERAFGVDLGDGRKAE